MMAFKLITHAATRQLLRSDALQGSIRFPLPVVQPRTEQLNIVPLAWTAAAPTTARRCTAARRRAALAVASTADVSAPSPPQAAHTHCVVNFYHLCEVSRPGQTAQDHKAYIREQGWDIRGRIYISHQGVNAQFSGPMDEALAYTEWLAAQPEFEGVQWRAYPVPRQMFPKLKLKYRPSLISLQGGTKELPVIDPEARATPLKPGEWKSMLANAKNVNEKYNVGQSQEKVVVLDVRNSYEWDAGHFEGAERPLEDEFRETPAGDDNALPAYLSDVDPSTPVLMYCTGGIRCDIYSTFLKKKGFNKLYTLEGGIQNYLDQEGNESWNGSLYVFDDRMAVSAGNMDGCEAKNLPAAVGCQLCGANAQLPHINCANVDCNLLFLACSACKERLQGCCCQQCLTNPPRLLRPQKDGSAPYRGMSNYVAPSPRSAQELMSPEKQARLQRAREKRRERLRARYAEEKAKKQELKAKAKALMKELEVSTEGAPEAAVQAAKA